MISAVVLTKNEENIIVDDNSNDRTLELLSNFKVKLYKRSLNDNFSIQRNFGLENATGDWVLFIDADERVTPLLKKEILYKTEANGEVSGFYFRRKDYFIGKPLNHGETASIKLLRLVKKRKGIWQGRVHEVINVLGKTESMENPIIHYPHKTLSEFLSEISSYSTLRAKELFESGKKTNFLSIILYPKAKFLLNFFIKKGFMDGIYGFIFSKSKTLAPMAKKIYFLIFFFWSISIIFYYLNHLLCRGELCLNSLFR